MKNNKLNNNKLLKFNMKKINNLVRKKNDEI